MSHNLPLNPDEEEVSLVQTRMATGRQKGVEKTHPIPLKKLMLHATDIHRNIG